MHNTLGIVVSQAGPFKVNPLLFPIYTLSLPPHILAIICHSQCFYTQPQPFFPIYFVLVAGKMEI